MRLFLLTAVAWLAVPVVAAEMYRCEDDDGVIRFQDRPCDGGPRADSESSGDGSDRSGGDAVAEAMEIIKRGEPITGDVDAHLREHRVEAELLCQRQVEAHAKYQFRWTDGWTTSKFDRRLAQKRTGFIELAGSKIEFQNGFGAWSGHAYRCVYDPRFNVMIEIEVW